MGTALLYSTYIGGNSDDVGMDIDIDGSGQAYVTGATNSFNYDIVPGAFQSTYGGGDYDVFVTKINAAGSALLYSTYIGGSIHDAGWSIAVDGSGQAYITGYTYSPDYDITLGAFQTLHGGGSIDVFVTKVNATGSALLYSTYIGASRNEVGYSIAIDAFGQAYISGYTGSPDYDITSGSFQTTFGGGVMDVFVTKVDATGTALLYSTYVGGSGNEYGYGIAVDAVGQIYITGYTGSLDYDITAGAFRTTYRGGLWDVFVTKICPEVSSGCSFLPITLLSFDAYCADNIVYLKWRTAAEKNNDYFIVERAKDGVIWEHVVNVKGAGTSNQPLSYEAADENPYSGISYYRLKQVDYSGNYSFFPKVAVECATKKEGFDVYPNPTTVSFTIVSEDGEEYVIMDVTGHITTQFRMEGDKKEMEVHGLKGIYFIRELESGAVKKLIIE